MSIDYRLTLDGEVPLPDLAARAFPDPADLARFEPYLATLGAEMSEQRGFAITLLTGRNGYLDAEGDDGPWEWEPERYTDLGFRMDKFGPPDRGTRNMVAAVDRVLRSGAENAALVLNGEVLVLTRFGGQLRKHNRERWWSYYPGAEASIPG
ncbi:SitI3 family protein [Micromonospora haikouensis]|uniref:SitI3 family protein n=1 Tax=Micromonospora haikouensis TaxID=686309 RepID=UPI0037922DA1